MFQNSARLIITARGGRREVVLDWSRAVVIAWVFNDSFLKFLLVHDL